MSVKGCGEPGGSPGFQGEGNTRVERRALLTIKAYTGGRGAPFPRTANRAPAFSCPTATRSVRSLSSPLRREIDGLRAVYALRMGLLDLIRRGDYVAASTPTPGPLRGRSLSLVEVATAVASGLEPLTAIRDFLDQVQRRGDDELAALIRERPELTGDRKADALLAGVAEHLAAVRGLSCPGWVLGQERFLDRFWFVSSVVGFRAVALAQTPIALKRRGVFWPARSLERV